MKAYDKSFRDPDWEGRKTPPKKRRRRHGPIGERYKDTGYAIEIWEGRTWEPIEYLPDAATMRRLYRIRGRAFGYTQVFLRMRFPGDKKSSFQPPAQWLARQPQRKKVERWEIPRGSGAFVRLIDSAMLESSPLDLVYRDGLGNKTRRRVLPEEWLGELCFIAYCELREDYRTFRIDRVLDCCHPASDA